MAHAPRTSVPALLGIGLALAVATSPLNAHAQAAVGVGVGPRVQLFSFDDAEAVGVSSMSLASVPLALSAEVGGGMRLGFSTAWFRSSAERSTGETVELSGLTDSTVDLTWSLPLPGSTTGLSVSAIGVLATGTTGFAEGEVELAGLLAADLLPFQLSNLGGGGGIGGGAALVHSAGAWGFAASGSYLTSGEFEPVQDPVFQYRPGNQLSLRGVVDRRVGTATRAALSVTILRSDDDQVDSETILRPGSRFQVLQSWAFPVGAAGSGLLYGGYLQRSGAELLPSGELRSDQGLVLLGGGLRTPSALGLLVPTTELRLLRRDDGEGQGWLLGVGASVERRRGGVTWEPSLVGRFGSITAAEGLESGITGVEAGLRVRFGSGR